MRTVSKSLIATSPEPPARVRSLPPSSVCPKIRLFLIVLSTFSAAHIAAQEPADPPALLADVDKVEETVAPKPTAAAPGAYTPIEVSTLRCPKGAHCIPDPELLSLLLLYRQTLSTEKTQGRPRTMMVLERLATTDDVRVVPLLVRASKTKAAKMRQHALRLLGRFASVPAASDRLLAALHPDASIDDATAALPGVLAAKPSAIPCPDVGREKADEDGTKAGASRKKDRCADDNALLAALMLVSSGRRVRDIGNGISMLGELGDPRGLGVVLGFTTSPNPHLRRTSLAALAGFEDQAARETMMAALNNEPVEDVIPLVSALTQRKPKWVADELLNLRHRPDARDIADKALLEIAPARIKKILHDEEAEREAERLASIEEVERQREAAEAERLAEIQRKAHVREELQRRQKEAAEREEFILRYGNRAGVAASAGLAGLYGGAFAASHMSTLLDVKDGGFTETVYGVWGGGVGMAAAATLSWFLMSDVELTLQDVGMTTSGSWMGAWVGLWAPQIIAGDEVDPRLKGYSTALGHLGGLTLASLGAAYLDPSWQDLAEVNAFVVAANLAAAGALLAAPTTLDSRVDAGAYVAATLLGATAGVASTFAHDLSARDFAHVATLTLTGAGAGFLGGAASAQFGRNFGKQSLGGTLFGASAGVMAGIGLASLQLTPGVGGMLYEVYAATAGAAAGMGSGLLLGLVIDDVEGVPSSFLPLAMSAGGAVGGMLTTAAVPNGVSLDVGDLLLQPLIIGLTLFQTGVLGWTANADPLLVIGSSLVVPTIASVTLLHTAPLVSPSLGDVAMITYTTAVGAALSALAISSAAAHLGDAVEPWMWIAATGAGMDLGVVLGVGLNFVDVDKLGWRVSYVSAVAAGTALALSFPGVVLADLAGVPAAVPDVILGTTALGLAVGLGTVWLIDFSVVPNLHLDEHIPLSLPEGLSVQPSFTPVMARNGREVIPVAGFGGTF